MPVAPERSEHSCPFCERISAGNLISGNGSAAALIDGFPLSPGHCLVVPRRHVADFFALTPQEQADIWRLVSELKARLDRAHAPQGYNVGINIGAAARSLKRRRLSMLNIRWRQSPGMMLAQRTYG